MPVIECHLLQGYSAEEKQRIGESLTDAVRLVVPAPADLVTVLIHEMPDTHYYRGRTTRKPAIALPEPGQRVEYFLKQLGQREFDAARNCVTDDFVMYFPATGAMHDFNELMQWAASRYRSIEKTIDSTEAFHSGDVATVVYCRGTLSGVWPDGETFQGIRFIDRFELIDGKIRRQDVWNDLAETRPGL